MQLKKRIHSVIANFDKYEIDAFLVSRDVNIRYLTDFPAEESYLLITREKIYYITDSRYYLNAKNVLKNFIVKCAKGSLFDEIASLVVSLNVKVLGINERHIKLFEHKILKAKLKRKVKLSGISYFIESQRMIKDRQELPLIRKALSYHKQAHAFLKKMIKPGRTEQEVLRRLEDFVRTKGVSFSFSPIIASGVNSCFPHARITQRKIRKNDMVLVDMGIDYKGYKSDLTRMFFLGRIPKSIREIYDFVSQAQQESLRIIKAGAPISLADKVARDFFARQKIDKNFTHALGHGVGMEVHEIPRVSSKNKDFLQEGMVITVEPGVYFPNQFGIRLEEMVLVKKQGCELLSDNIN